MLFSLVFVNVCLQPKAWAISKIIPLSINQSKLDWKSAIFACEDQFDVSLVSDKTSVKKLEQIVIDFPSIVNIWTGIYRRLESDGLWWNQDGEAVYETDLPYSWCESSKVNQTVNQTGHNCLKWQRRPNLGRALDVGKPCLQPDDCRSLHAFACEALRIDFDSITSKSQEKAFTSQGWKITSGIGSKNSFLTEGPLFDADYSDGTRVIELGPQYYDGSRGIVNEILRSRKKVSSRNPPINAFVKSANDETSMWVSHELLPTLSLKTTNPIIIKTYSMIRNPSISFEQNLSFSIISKPDCGKNYDWNLNKTIHTSKIHLYVVELTLPTSGKILIVH